MTPEGRVELAADRLMGEALGYTSIHFSQRRASKQTPGIPDRRYYKGRHAFWFEAKAPGKELNQSQPQKDFQMIVKAAGEDYVLGGIPELVTYLDKLGICRQLPSGVIWHAVDTSGKTRRALHEVPDELLDEWDAEDDDPIPPTPPRSRAGGPTSLIGE